MPTSRGRSGAYVRYASSSPWASSPGSQGGIGCGGRTPGATSTVRDKLSPNGFPGSDRESFAYRQTRHRRRGRFAAFVLLPGPRAGQRLGFVLDGEDAVADGE